MTVKLDNLPAVPGARKARVRRGRGFGSGLGKQAGRGGKGQTARTGKGRRVGFEGGQTPLYRRLPKFGFKNPFRLTFEVVNVVSLEGKFNSGDTVDPAGLAEKGLIRSADSLVKVLGDGALSKKLTVKAHKFSKSAVQKINQAGGQVEEMSLPGSRPEE
jgi:large subunit ribosomal protein L15